MKQQISLEQIIFFATAKAVREEQEYRLRQHEDVKKVNEEYEKQGQDFRWELTEKEKRTSMFIHVYDTTVYSNAYALCSQMEFTLSQKQFWAVFYKLEKMEMVKIHKGNSKKLTMLGLGKKGVDYVKNIKLKAAN